MELNKQLEDKIVIYITEDGLTQVDVRLENETVWLTQSQIAVLFGTKRPAITKHLKNIYDSKELDECSTCSILEHMGNSGKQVYNTKYYNLDMILSVGYRVKSERGIMFRQWANTVLKEFLLRGYAVNHRIDAIEASLHRHDHLLEEHERKIDFFVRTSLPPIEGIFYDGQIFDAYVFVSDLIKSARKRLILIDNYVDESVLMMLSKREAGVSAEIRTGRFFQQLQLDLERHNIQYAPVSIIQTPNIHDRFLIVDDDVYHIGASLKDLGKKLFAFSKMTISPDLLIS